jgi:hypothetical protein
VVAANMLDHDWYHFDRQVEPTAGTTTDSVGKEK